MSMKALRLTMVALVSAAAVGASAFTMQPMSTLLSPSGEGSIATFRIKNDQNERIAIRFKTLTRGVAADGKETNESADDLFMIYPARVLIQPGMSASVKLQWRGPASVDAERCFRFVAEQVALDANPAAHENSSITIMFRYIASLYVGQPGFQEKLTTNVVGAADSDGSDGFLVEISNVGKRHIVATEASIDLGGTLRPLTSEELGPLSGANYLPGTSRSLFVPRPEAQVGQHYDDASLVYKGEY
jgi:fimbrial chaperone protein